MITWHTMFSYGATARTLDDRRLGVQKDQALEILNALTGLESEIPENHPVLRMWTGYEYALAIYGMFQCMEWTMKRGFADKAFWELGEAIQEIGGSYEAPPWIHDKDVVRSHRSNLMRRWPESFQWDATPVDLPYIWPIVDGDGGYDLMVAKEERELLAAGERRLPKKMRERVVNL